MPIWYAQKYFLEFFVFLAVQPLPHLGILLVHNDLALFYSVVEIQQRRRIMPGTDIREIIAEETQVQRHKEALDSLVRMRAKLLRESLEGRIRRAQDHGDWSHLTQKECAGQHREEKLYLKSQVERLRREQTRTEGKLAELRQAKKRAQLIRAAEVGRP
jgi:hypothetical protein